MGLRLFSMDVCVREGSGRSGGCIPSGPCPGVFEAAADSGERSWGSKQNLFTSPRQKIPVGHPGTSGELKTDVEVKAAPGPTHVTSQD